MCSFHGESSPKSFGLGAQRFMTIDHVFGVATAQAQLMRGAAKKYFEPVLTPAAVAR
jgi:hypothetical protein